MSDVRIILKGGGEYIIPMSALNNNLKYNGAKIERYEPVIDTPAPSVETQYEAMTKAQLQETAEAMGLPKQKWRMMKRETLLEYIKQNG